MKKKGIFIQGMFDDLNFRIFCPPVFYI